MQRKEHTETETDSKGESTMNAATTLASQILDQMTDDDRRDFDEDAWREGIALMVGPGTDAPDATVDEVIDAMWAQGI